MVCSSKAILQPILITMDTEMKDLFNQEVNVGDLVYVSYSSRNGIGGIRKVTDLSGTKVKVTKEARNHRWSKKHSMWVSYEQIIKAPDTYEGN